MTPVAGRAAVVARSRRRCGRPPARRRSCRRATSAARVTHNVIAELPGTDPGRVVMAGAAHGLRPARAGHRTTTRSGVAPPLVAGRQRPRTSPPPSVPGRRRGSACCAQALRRVRRRRARGRGYLNVREPTSARPEPRRRAASSPSYRTSTGGAPGDVGRSGTCDSAPRPGRQRPARLAARAAAASLPPSRARRDRIGVGSRRSTALHGSAGRRTALRGERGVPRYRLRHGRDAVVGLRRDTRSRALPTPRGSPARRRPSSRRRSDPRSDARARASRTFRATASGGDQRPSAIAASP